MKGTIAAAALGGALLMATPALAQRSSGAERAPRPDPAVQVRHEMLVMERVLEQKVQFAAQRLNDRFREAGMPDVGLLTGAAKARGTRLDGYGVFFDLEVPAVRQSVFWSLRTLGRPDPVLADVLGALRGLERAIDDPAMKASFQSALGQLETRIDAPAGMRVAARPFPSGAVSAAALGQPPSVPVEPPVVDDPAEVYTGEVRSAVIDAILDHGGPMNLSAAEWFAVAARDDMDRHFLSGDPNEIPRTMVIRVRGSDLAGFREGRLTREEALTRVEVKDF